MGKSTRRTFLQRTLGTSTSLGIFSAPAIAQSRSARYRVAVIGSTGRGNYGHGLDTVWLDVPETQVVAVADDDDSGLARAVQRLGGVRGFSDYRRMLDEVRPDIVAIAPRWVDRHRDMALAAAQRGIHIYMEKPFCRTPAEADEIVAAVEAHKVQLAIAHQTRYSPTVEVIREIIEQGKIGPLLELRGRGKEDHRGGGEDLWVLGSHIMNLIYFFGGAPQSCYATLTQGGRPVERQDVREGNEGLGPLAGDRVDVQYSLEGGRVAYFSSVRETGGSGDGRFGLQLLGAEGVVGLRTGYPPEAYYLAEPFWSPGPPRQPFVPISSAGLNRPEPIREGGLHAGNVAAVRDLLSAIESGKLPRCNVYEARMTVEMICAVFASHVARAPVKWPLQERGNALGRL